MDEQDIVIPGSEVAKFRKNRTILGLGKPILTYPTMEHDMIEKAGLSMPCRRVWSLLKSTPAANGIVRIKREAIAIQLGFSAVSLNHISTIIKKLREAGLIRNLAPNVYWLNPLVAYRGNWREYTRYKKLWLEYGNPLGLD